MLIQYKLQPLPNDGSRSNWRSRDGSFERNFAKENDKGGGKASFARFWHPDTRNVQQGTKSKNVDNRARSDKDDLS